MEINLLVTGDLHLGRHPGHVPEELDSRKFSPGAVWHRMVDEAIRRRVDAVLVTGDLIDRENLFVTTKIDPRRRSFAEMVESVSDSCDRLGLEWVDLLLIHWPNPLAEFERVITALDAARNRGLTQHVGVSNFRRKKLDRAQALADSPIVTDQVLFNPWWRQRDLLRYFDLLLRLEPWDSGRGGASR